MFKSIIMFIGLLLIIGMSANTLSQSDVLDDHDRLVYLKSRLNTTGQYITLAQGQRYIYDLPEGKGSIISPDGVYVMEGPPTTEGDFVIRKAISQEVVVQLPWPLEWEPYSFVWLENDILSMQKAGTSRERLRYVVEGSSLTPIDYQFTSPPTPSLPEYLPEIRNNFLLQAPNEVLYLYERCNGLMLDGDLCTSNTFVVYDTQQQQTLETLEGAYARAIRGYADWDDLRRGLTYEGAAWSSNSRYLAYYPYGDGLYDYFNLSVYDVQEDTYLDTDWINAWIAQEKAMQWSPIGNKLLFWTQGRLQAEVQPDDQDTLHSLVVYDADTQSFDFVRQPFDLSYNLGEAGVWSPDGMGYVFIDNEKRLFHVDVRSMAVTLLDTNVAEIVIWSGDSAPVVSPQIITSFTLVDAETEKDIYKFNEGYTIYQSNITIRANTEPPIVGSVVFGLDDEPRFKVENEAAYALKGDDNGDYHAWLAEPGTYTLTATPYTEADGQGEAGTPLTITFTVAEAGS